ncbi:hypothetical protein PCIT_a1688 [Pseudoalteromonas citrea]|uniref:Prepilin-type cleavage/methylation domain-containing protein n=2 Tax=Pseudoalteromonas citrea TaxID=43655 RepID=A0AAD4AML5_9GAMM|nr:prepilin-type N-terminal cleavage/methylation domain-containing protein [Pseudoalteromonas citrea]KAF7775486.1 hypothetical protein PCIT_a1688 [Pseudoalteromonas citrea]
MKNKVSGFTLIEILIASVILFSSIAVVAELFSAGNLTSSKIIKSSQLSHAIYASIPTIKEELRSRLFLLEKPEYNSGVISSNSVALAWTANIVERFAPPSDIDDLYEQPKRYAVYRVSVREINSDKLFSFNVVVW